MSMKNIDTVLNQIDQAIQAVQSKMESSPMMTLAEKIPYNRARTALQKARFMIRKHYHTIEDALNQTERRRYNHEKV